jgi:hypothetical protein
MWTTAPRAGWARWALVGALGLVCGLSRRPTRPTRPTRPCPRAVGHGTMHEIWGVSKEQGRRAAQALVPGQAQWTAMES